MNKARTGKLSLRKLFLAMLAAGPVAILPSPLLAVVPTSTPFTVQNGAATWLGSGSTGTINVTSPNSVLVWGTTAPAVGATYAGTVINDGTSFSNFNIQTGETFNFNVPSGSAVLNKVSAGSNATHTMFNGLGAAAAVVNGTLNAGSGRVAILSTSGNIIVGTGAQIITGGLVLSTLTEDSSNFSFTSGGNLALASGNTSNGQIFLGTGGGTVATVVGNLTAAAGQLTLNNLSVSGDLIVNQTSNAAALNLTSASTTTVGGNLTATSNTTAITQGAGALSVVNGVASFNNTSGNTAVTLNNAANDFNTVRFSIGTTNATAADVTIRDANAIVLGNATASSISNNLTVNAAGNITTGGAVAVTNTANLVNTAGLVSFASGSAAGNIAVSSTSNVTIATTGNTTTKAISAGGSDVSISAGNLTIDGAIASTANVSLTSASINSTTNGSIGTNSRSVAVTGNSATGNVVLPGISARSLSVTTAGGSVSQVGTGITNIIAITGNGSVDGAVTINATSAGNITLGANNTFGGTNSTVNLTGNSVSLTTVSNVTLGALDVAGNVTVNTTGSTFGNGTVNLGVGGGSTAPSIKIGGNLTVSTNGSNVQDDPQAAVSIFGAITVNTMAAGYGQLANNVTVTSGGSGFLRAPNVVITGNSGGSNATATATVNTTTGALTGLSVTNGGGGFNAAPTINYVGAGVPTTAATVGTITTFGAAGNLGVGSIAVGTAGTGYTAAPTVVIGTAPSGGTNATATAVVDTTTGTLLSINITNPGSGYTAAPTVTLLAGGNGGVTAPTLSSAIIPAGNVNFTAQGNQGSGTFGQFNVTAAAVNIIERTTVNLGNINAASLSAQSTTGDVLVNGAQNINNNGGWAARANTGNITQINGAISAGTGTVTANINGSTGSVNLTNSSNMFGTLSYNSSSNATGNILVNSSVNVDRVAVGANSTIAVTTTGTGSNITVTAGSFNNTATFNSAGIITFTSNNNTNAVAARNLVLIAADTGASSITQNTAAASQIMNVNGTLTISTPGGVTLAGNNNPSLGNIVLANVTGSTSELRFVSRGNITNVSGNAAGTVNLTSGAVGQNSTPIASTITLGNLNVGNLIARALNGGVGNQNVTGVANEAANLPNNGASGNITQVAGSSLHVENTLTAVTYNGGNIVLANNGNSAGRVQLSTAGALPGGGGTFAQTAANTSGTITYTEDGTARLGALQTSGAATITSRFGSIIEDPATSVDINVGGNLGLEAPAGSVSLGGTTRTAGTTTTNLTAVSGNSAGSFAVVSSGNLALGSVAANSLTVQALNVTQSAAAKIFGSASFNATVGGGNITLNNADNSFGPITLISGVANGAAISVTEGPTMNLRSVQMTAGNTTFTANSVNGDIIDTGLGGVRLGGSIIGGVTTTGSGVVTLTATNGNIVIDDPTSDIITTGGVVFNGRNVTLSVLGSTTSTLVLGGASNASSASGNLTATSALGNIGNAGRISVGGLATLQTGNGNITIDQPNVGFGSLRFTGNQVRINEAGGTDIVSGSSAFGPAQIVSGGSINIVAVDGQNVTFGNNVALQATGDINLRQTQVVGTLSLSHTGTANLSALSKSTDLNGKDPVDLGTGPTVAPKP
jgi:hypothetical protein